jgi:hypothetical protein
MNKPYKEPTTCQKVVDDNGRRCGKPATMWIGLGAVLCYECGSEAAKIASRAWGIDADV